MKFEALFECVNSNVTKIEVETDTGTISNGSIMRHQQPHKINHTPIVSDAIYFIVEIIVYSFGMYHYCLFD